MLKRFLTIGALGLLLAGGVGMGLQQKVDAGPAMPFELASVHFEQNATDGDVEVVFKVKGGGNTGLARLTTLSPDGRTVIDFSAPGSPTFGIRQFVFESPEPGDVDSLKAAYPEGTYTFSGATAAGTRLHAKASLSHTLPATATFLHPGDKSEGVGIKNLAITWTPLKNLTAYLIEIEQEELGVNVTAKLPGSATTFNVPEGFLLPDTEYKLAIGTVTEEGNASFVEKSFTTAEKG